jgi:hypothetical protein
VPPRLKVCGFGTYFPLRAFARHCAAASNHRKRHWEGRKYATPVIFTDAATFASKDWPGLLDRPHGEKILVDISLVR